MRQRRELEVNELVSRRRRRHRFELAGRALTLPAVISRQAPPPMTTRDLHTSSMVYSSTFPPAQLPATRHHASPTTNKHSTIGYSLR